MRDKVGKKFFRSMDELEAYYFPNSYAKRKREEEIEKHGIGKVLAREFLDAIEEALK